MSPACRIVCASAFSGLLLSAWPDAAWAQPEDLAARAAARDLGNEGVKAYQQGDYTKARERLERAYSVVRAPTLALWLGRTLVQQGLLVEASEVFLEATRLAVTGGDLTVQTKAQKDAEADRNLLLPRLARLTVVVENVAPGQTPTASVDGQPMAEALIGVEHPANPGRHVISVAVGGQTQEREVTLAEGAREGVVFRFDTPNAAAPPPVPSVPATAPPAAAEPAPAPPVLEPARPAPSVPAAQPADRGSDRATPWYAYAAWGVGGLGLATGAIAGVLAMKKRDGPALSEACTGNSCASWAASDVDQYNTLRTVSTAGFVVGAVGISSAVFVHWFLPRIQQAPSRAALEPSPGVSVLMGPGQAGLAVNGWY